MSQELTKVNGGLPAPQATITVEGFGTKEVTPYAETAAAAVAAREQAAIQARCVMAMQRPRNVDDFRVALIKECKRPGFAATAEYQRPVGKEKNENTGEWEEKIATGPSIHLIRTALALYKNVMADSQPLFDSQDTRIVHAFVVDIETNVSWGRTLTISKIVEKRGVKKGRDVFPPPGKTVIGERVNTFGEKVYICLATEDELRTKESRLTAIAQRENGRSLLPRDIIDEALTIARKTIADADAHDPDGARRKVIDAFADIGIKPSDLTEYLAHDLDRMTPAELKQLRGIYSSLRDGEVTWTEVMEAKDPVSGSKEQAEEAGRAKIAELRNRQKDTPKQENGSGSSSAQVKTSESGETASGDAPERREIPPASTPGPSEPPANLKNLEDWPDQPVDEWYAVRGTIYHSPARDGNYTPWIPKPKAEKQNRLNLGGRK